MVRNNNLKNIILLRTICSVFIVLLIVSSGSYSVAQSPAELLNHLEVVKTDSVRIDIYNKLFLVYEFSDTVKAKDYLQKSLKLASKIQYKKGLIETHKHIGFLMEDKGKYSEAYANYEKMLNICKEIDDQIGVAYAYNYMGIVYIHQGNFLKAIDNCNKGLEIAKKINHIDLISKLDNNLGICYYNIQQFDLAIEHYDRTIKIARETGKDRVLALALDNIGATYRAVNEFDMAIESHQQSLEMWNKLDNKQGIASCYLNLGIIYALKGDSISEFYQLAIDNYDKAYDIYSKHGTPLQISNCMFNAATLYKRMKEWDKAYELVKRSHDINLEMGGVDDLRNTYRLLAECKYALEDYKKAYDYYKQFKIMFDSLINVENVKKITTLEMQHDFDKQQKVRELEQQKQEELFQVKQKRQKTIIYSLLIGIFLVLIMAFLIFRSYRIKQKTNVLLNKQKNEIEEKSEQITSSIKYAQRIQKAILPPDKLVKNALPDSFIFNKAKDIVSGDFYWVTETKGKILFAVVDCTGHGVPGAFISIIGENGLKRAVYEFGLQKPSEILDKLSVLVNNTLRQKYEDSSIRDGMDVALCCLDKESNKLQFSGAYNPLYIVRNKELIVIKADKQPVGQFLGEMQRSFTNHFIDIQKNDMIYLFSDGFPDLFGGETEAARATGGRKFKTERFRKLLQEIAELPVDEQKEILTKTAYDWLGELDQLDDICVMGVRMG